MSLKAKLTIGIVCQLIILVGMVGFKHFTLLTGKPILLETVPVDPRSLFRGDYVILRYKISRLKSGIIKEQKMPKRGDSIYVVLRKGDEFWEPTTAFLSRPVLTEGEIFIKGTIVSYRWAKSARVEYGIETYFIPEGKGRVIEAATRGEKSHLSVEVAVDRFGCSVIRQLFIDEKPVKLE